MTFEPPELNVDLAVIGTGAAGSSVAFACRSAGWSVAIIDALPFGGTCQLRGCDPKKVLVAAEELVDWSRRFAAKGVVKGDISIDWPGLMRFKTAFTAPAPQQNEQTYADAGIAMFHGRARFVGRRTLEVGTTTLQARHVVIATGAKPQTLGIAGEELLTKSDDFLDLTRLPARIVMVGGGYISFEFAHVAARAGAHVTIIHRGARPLEHFDPDLVDMLVASTRELGIDVRLESKVHAIERHGEQLSVNVVNSDGTQTSIVAEMAVHGAGRVPDIDDLDLVRAEVAHTAKGIAVDAFLQSVSNPAVYAAGDVVDSAGLPLTPVAGMLGEVVAENLLHGNRRTPNFSEMPSAVFTTPTLAAVGLTEHEATARGLNFEAKLTDTSGWYSSRRLAVSRSATKVLIHNETNQILGVHILGPGAEELVNVCAMAIRFELPADQLKNVVFAYPTAASDLSSIL